MSTKVNIGDVCWYFPSLEELQEVINRTDIEKMVRIARNSVRKKKLEKLNKISTKRTK